MFDEIKNFFLKKNRTGRDGFTKWSNGLKKISDFISDNKRLPNASSDNKSENNLYQSYSATKRKFNSKKLSDKQLEFLEQHNIVFDNIKSISDKWKMKVQEISDFITKNEHYPKANRKDVNEEKLYHALARIRRAKDKDKLSVEQSDFLDQNNIILENNISISDKWKMKVLEISDFITKNEHYPKANRNDVNEEKLYHALARIRRANEKGKLSVEQSDFLTKNNIDLENNNSSLKAFKSLLINKIHIEDINNEQVKLDLDNHTVTGSKISKKELKIRFETDVSDFFDIEKTNINPFKVKHKLSGLEFNIFLKNISPAYFSNKNVSRIQIARTTHFKEIKKKQEICIPIGYDKINETYIVWNPFLFLERINKKNNISIYSRFTTQRDAAYNRWVELVLSSHEKLYCVNKNYIADFIINFDQYFQDINTKKLLDSENNINNDLQKGFITNSIGLNNVKKLINDRKFIEASNLFAELAFQENIKDFKKIRKEYNKFCDKLD